MKSKKLNAVCDKDGLRFSKVKKFQEHIDSHKPQHIPTPWKMNEGFNGDIFGPENQWIAKVVDVRKTESKTNAYIVKAVNAHDEILAALNEALSKLENGEMPTPMWHEKAHIALAKAEGR